MLLLTICCLEKLTFHFVTCFNLRNIRIKGKSPANVCFFDRLALDLFFFAIRLQNCKVMKRGSSIILWKKRRAGMLKTLDRTEVKG